MKVYICFLFVCLLFCVAYFLYLFSSSKNSSVHLAVCNTFTIFLSSYHKNIKRHTGDTIVSWPNPKQWVIVHTSDLMMIIRQSIYILSIITREMGKLITYSPTYCIMDNGENMLNFTPTLDRIYLTGILWVQCLQISLHNYDNEMLYCTNKRLRSASQNVSEYLHSS